MGLNTTGVLLGGQYFTVMDYPTKKVMEKGPSVLSKAIAYRYSTEMTHGLFPYRGVITLEKRKKWKPSEAKVGIYFIELHNNGLRLYIRRPRTKQEADEHRIGNEKDILAATLDGEYTPDQFADVNIHTGEYGEAFMPPLRSNDDPLNTIIKTMIRLKHAPFEPYGRRLEALAADRSKKLEGVNIKNNSKRALWGNATCSPTKGTLYSTLYDTEMAIVLKDKPNPMHPMDIEDGEMLVIYPNSVPFYIDGSKLIDISPYVAENLEETSGTREQEEDK